MQLIPNNQRLKVAFMKTYINEEISANKIVDVPITEYDKNTHRFFNDLLIMNTSATLIHLIPDHDDTKLIPVPSGFTIGLSFTDDNLRFSSLQIEEQSGNVVEAGTVRTVVMKKVYEPIKAGEDY